MPFYEVILGNSMLCIHIFITSKEDGTRSNVKEYSIIALGQRE